MDQQAMVGSLGVIALILLLGMPSVYLGRNKNRSLVVNFLLGVLLGPIGWLIAWKMKPPLTPEEREELQRQLEARKSDGSEWQ